MGRTLTSIVERLRVKGSVPGNPYGHYLREAADEIERLRKLVAAQDDRNAKYLDVAASLRARVVELEAGIARFREWAWGDFEGTIEQFEARPEVKAVDAVLSKEQGLAPDPAARRTARTAASDRNQD